MTSEDPRGYYDAEYAAAYDGDWADGPLWSIEAGHTVRSLAQVVSPDTRWLDVGCGTGWFLSRFPGVPRAGTDYSPAMLEQARAANPDALFFQEADAREARAEWDGAWDVVTCTGQPYSYFASIDETEAFAANLAAWTAIDGTCVVQICDLRDLVGHQLTYDFDDDIADDSSIALTAALWTWRDSTGTLHRNMIWVTLDVWVRWFKRWFKTVEVIEWPHDPPFPYLYAPRRLLVMTDKRRSDDDDGPATVIVHPPMPLDRPEEAVAADPPGSVEPEVEAANDRGDRSEVAAAEKPAPVPVTAAAAPVVPTTDGVSTAALADELLHRLGVLGRRGARKTARRVRRLGRSS